MPSLPDMTTPDVAELARDAACGFGAVVAGVAAGSLRKIPKRRAKKPPPLPFATGAAAGFGIVGVSTTGSGRSGAGVARTTPATAGCSGSSLGRSICGSGAGCTGVVR